MARQIRTRRTQVEADTTNVERLMKSISQNQDTINALSEQVKQELASLHVEMAAHGITSHTVDGILAERFIPAGKSTSFIDPKVFRKEVTDDKDFYSAIKVSITAAENVLPGKVIERIKQVTPPKPHPESIRVLHATEKRK